METKESDTLRTFYIGRTSTFVTMSYKQNNIYKLLLLFIR